MTRSTITVRVVAAVTTAAIALALIVAGVVLGWSEAALTRVALGAFVAALLLADVKPPQGGGGVGATLLKAGATWGVAETAAEIVGALGSS